MDEARKAFATDFLKPVGSETGVQPEADQKTEIDGITYHWRLMRSESAVIDLIRLDRPSEFVIAYAWAEIEMSEPTTMLFGIGSDDAVKMWLNGKMVHENWTQRPVFKDDDLVELQLRKGKNQLLLKLLNMEGKWAFACRPLNSAGLEEKLVSVAGRGDLDAVKALLDRGVNMNGKDKHGLTAAQSAKIYGHKEVADFLLGRGADASPARPEYVIDAMFKEIVPKDGPGAAVLAAQNGRIIFEKGYGLANVEHRVPVRPETKFRIGSITKQFIAAAILKLHEQGKLDLDDKLSKFIPDYPRGDEATIHHLLTHTSGIHSFNFRLDFTEVVATYGHEEDTIKWFKDDPYDFDPGKKYSYNNSGYFLLGHVIRKAWASGDRRYGAFLRETFFQPLGMKSTDVHRAQDVIEDEAHGYAWEGGKVTKARYWDMSRIGGAGALYSTVRDLYRWNEALFSGEVLSDASLKTAFTPAKTVEDEGEDEEGGYGYGWGISSYRGLKQISHDGGLPGFTSSLLRMPEEKFTVVVLANAVPPLPDLDTPSLAHEIMQLCLADKLAPFPKPISTNVVASRLYDAYVGRYGYKDSSILAVTREGERLFAQLTGQARFELFPKSETEFFWKDADAQLTFIKGQEGTATKAVHRQGGRIWNALRLPAQTIVRIAPAILDAYVGDYDYGTGKRMTVTRDGERLFAQFGGTIGQLTGYRKLQIFPKSDTEFFWKAIDAQITFLKDADGKVIKAIHQQRGEKIEAPKVGAPGMTAP